MSRRGFLRGRRKEIVESVRPPWALPERAFAEACTRCGACADKCPNGIIVAGDGGFPVVDFTRSECSFCGECAVACADGALVRAGTGLPWRLQPLIAATCMAQNNVVCRSCGDSCEPQAIRFRPRLGAASMPELAADLCTGCGACVGVCPTQSIRMINLQTNQQQGVTA